MKITAKVIAATVIMLNIGVTSTAVFAKLNSYYPPERIHCTLDDSDKLSCSEFNRQYLIEDTYTAHLQKGKDNVFYFASGAAYFSQNHQEATVFYTYKNTLIKIVKLRTINSSIMPDLKTGNWKKISDDLYTCDAGYMHCAISVD